jgi:hypothetical protein
LVLILAPAAGISGQTTARDIEAALDRTALVHPYVYFNAKEKASLLERAKTDPVCGDYLTQLLAESNRLLFTPVETTAPARSKQPRYDAAYENENWLSENTSRAYTLALAYQMTGERRYAEKAFAFADAVCGQPTWVHGAHEFPVIYDRVWPWGAKDDQVVFSYAQWTDHLVVQLAAVYDWLYPALGKRERDRIRGALLEKAVLCVRGNYDYHWWAAAYRCNWCAVLNASLGIASAALLTEDPQLVDVIAESYVRIGKCLDEVGDGGWQEGVSYMGYMLGETVRFADVMRRITGGKLDLYEHPRMHDAAATLLYCQFPPDKSVHFGDAGGGTVGGYDLFNRLAAATGDRAAAWLLANRTNGRPGSLLECITPRSVVEPGLPSTASRHFRTVGWVILRSDFTDPEKVSIACKSGLNNDPHHGHLDQGHVSLYWRGCEFLCDHGSAGYDKAYFDRDRWDYPLAASRGHNVVMVDGEEQVCGKLKDTPWNENIGGKVLLFRPGKDRDYTLLDPTGAYPGKHLKSWRRHVVLEKPRITVILDEVACAPLSEVEARFHSAAAQDVRGVPNVFNEHVGVPWGNWVSLTSGKDRMALIPAVTGEFTLRTGRHAILMAQRNASFRWVPYVGMVTRAAGERTILAAIVLPVGSDGEAEKVVQSVRKSLDGAGNFTLSFETGGKKYEYRFRSGDWGMVME